MFKFCATVKRLGQSGPATAQSWQAESNAPTSRKTPGRIRYCPSAAIPRRNMAAKLETWQAGGNAPTSRKHSTALRLNCGQQPDAATLSLWRQLSKLGANAAGRLTSSAPPTAPIGSKYHRVESAHANPAAEKIPVGAGLGSPNRALDPFRRHMLPTGPDPATGDNWP